MVETKKKLSGRKAVLVSFVCLFSIFAAVWIGLAIFLHNEQLADMLALHPSVGSDGYEATLDGLADRESMFVPAADGSKLHAWLFKVPGATKIALVSHGNGGNNIYRLYLASALTKAGVNVLLYDYRGYGISTGKAKLRNILEDGDTMYEFVKTKLKYKPEQIVLYGESIGTAVTCHIASHSNCAGVILQSPITSLPNAARFVFLVLRVFPDFVFPEPQLSNIQLISQIKCPILLMHGMKDTIVDSNGSKLLYDQANEPKSLVYLPDCGHNDMGAQNSDTFNDSIKKFIDGLK